MQKHLENVFDNEKIPNIEFSGTNPHDSDSYFGFKIKKFQYINSELYYILNSIFLNLKQYSFLMNKFHLIKIQLRNCSYDINYHHEIQVMFYFDKSLTNYLYLSIDLKLNNEIEGLLFDYFGDIFDEIENNKNFNLLNVIKKIKNIEKYSLNFFNQILLKKQQNIRHIKISLCPAKGGYNFITTKIYLKELLNKEKVLQEIKTQTSRAGAVNNKINQIFNFICQSNNFI